MRNVLTTTFPRGGLILASATVFLAGFGCGTDPRATVSGTVKLNGAPINSGTLEFRTSSGTGVLALVPITDGAYRVTADAKLKPGNYKIEFFSTTTGEVVGSDSQPVRPLRHFGYGIELKLPPFWGDIAARIIRQGQQWKKE